MALRFFVMTKTWLLSRNAASGEAGASAVEYALLAALIAAVIVLIVTAIGSKVSNDFSIVNSALP